MQRMGVAGSCVGLRNFSEQSGVVSFWRNPPLEGWIRLETAGYPGGEVIHVRHQASGNELRLLSNEAAFVLRYRAATLGK